MTVYISYLKAIGFGCLKHVEANLTPFHAFVGPNDSGKSTLLNAAKSLVAFVGGHNKDDANFPQLFAPEKNMHLRMTMADTVSQVAFPDYVVTRDKGFTAQLVLDSRSLANVPAKLRKGGLMLLNESVLEDSIREQKVLPEDVNLRREWSRKPTRSIQWDASALREPSGLLTTGSVSNFIDSRGKGLPGVYDVVLNKADNSFKDVVDRVINRFPSVRSVRMKNLDESRKEIIVELKTGEVVPARHMSEGFLYYLAFLAIQHLDPPSVLLIEEPENGLHPGRIADVVGVLREISKTTQVLIATHSPLVINEMQPEEVSVVTRDPEEGTKVTLMSETPNFEERSKIYALGELWLSYCDDKDEGPLLDPEVP